jgi:AcrR family transcriptional regulator
MARARPLTAEDRRASLVAAARAVFAEQGYHAANITDIIDRAGVARGTFYNHFESKRSILQAVLEDVMDHVIGAIDPIDVTRPIALQVREMIFAIVSATAEPGVVRLLFTEAVGIDAEGDTAIRAFYDGAALRLQRALETGVRLGVVADGDLRLSSHCMIGLLKEPLFQANLRGEALDPDALTDLLVGLLTHGVLRAGRAG